MKLVINASPLIFLAKVDAINLLSDCFDAILTLPAVVAEIGALRLPSFINVTLIRNSKVFARRCNNGSPNGTGKLQAGRGIHPVLYVFSVRVQPTMFKSFQTGRMPRPAGCRCGNALLGRGARKANRSG